MNSVRTGPLNLQAVPTLTEVIEMPAFARGSGERRPAPLADASAAPAESAVQQPVAEPPAFDEEHLVQRVLADLQRNADLMLEYRLRQALTPAMARLTDALVNEVRDELVVTLRDVVARAVSQELARQRGR